MATPSQVSQHRKAGVLSLIARLVRRPARTDRCLPLIWLSGLQSGAQALDVLDGRLRGLHRHKVPHARVRAEEEANSDARQLLHTLCLRLRAPQFGGERLWFRYYELAEWLVGKNLSDPELGSADPPTKIARLLRERSRESRGGNDRPEIGAAPDWDPTSFFQAAYQLLMWLILRVAPDALFRAAVSGKVPGAGRRYRWFMRQQYMAPLRSVNFLGFAERLTVGIRQPEDIDQIDKLLVHAFLEDLRRAYARKPWRIEGWRRTAYPIVLIDDASPNTGGSRLLQLINDVRNEDVRNETGRSDPLLVVCASDQVPPASTTAAADSVVESEERGLRRNDPVCDDPLYRAWATALPGSRHARVDTAWYLPISLTEPDEPPPAPRPAIVPPRQPWFTRRVVVVVAMIMLVATLAGSMIGWYVITHGGLGCLHRPFGKVSVRSIDGQCIGYSDSDSFLFSDQRGQEKLRDVQNLIFQQNAEVREIWERNRRRPYITIVYLGSLSGRATTDEEEAYVAEREELEGLAVAQYERMKRPGSENDSALLNIVIANAGYQMRYADQAVEMIAELAREDPTIVAVVGLVESRASTAKALRELNRAGLPVIASNMSADKLSENSRIYLQIPPPNLDQATMLAEYARQELKVSEARVYWTVGDEPNPEEDLYVSTLVAALNNVLPNSFGVRVEYSRHFRGDRLDNECGYPGMLIFAGRWTEFGRFLKELERCGSNQPRNLVADDSVNRYMANPVLRDSAPGNLPMAYVSKSALASCQYLARHQDELVRERFLRLIQKPDLLTPPRCVDRGDGELSEPVGERVSLAYDSAMLLIGAVENLADRLGPDEKAWDPRSITPVAVHAEMFGQYTVTPAQLPGKYTVKPFEGVSGSIRFDPSGVPVQKRISLLRVRNIPKDPPVEVFHCGIAQPDDDAACRKP